MPRAQRRRQRGTRLGVAAGLLVTAAAGVAMALPTGSFGILALAAAAAVVQGAAATRITHAELLDSRRDAALDRATLAQDYRVLTERRSAEHRAFAETMTGRVQVRETRIADLTRTLVEAEETLARTRLRLGMEARRAGLAEAETAQARGDAGGAAERVAALEAELDAARVELDTVRAEVAAWQAAPVWTRRA